MGKGKSPTPNELKFVYELIADGYSDTDVLAKYAELKRHGKLGIPPYRQDVRFIRQRRKEFEAAKGILRTSLESQVDPTIAKAREEHFAEIRDAIEKLWGVFPCEFPHFDDTYEDKLWKFGLNNLPYEVNRVCGRAIFKSVRQHIVSEDFWRKYAEWEKLWAESVENCERLKISVGELSEQANTWPNIIKIRENFQLPIASEVTGRQFGTDELATLRFDIRGKNLWCSFKYPDGEYSIQYIILEAEQPEEHIIRYKLLINEVLNLNETKKIIEISDKLNIIQWEICQNIEDILIRKAWVTSKCQWCPV